MTYYGRFTQYIPETLPEGMPEELQRLAVWIRNEDGVDMYALRETLPTDCRYLVLNDDDSVRIVTDDPHRLWPADGRLYTVAADFPMDPQVLFRQGFDPGTGALVPLPAPPVLRRYSKPKLFAAMSDDEFALFSSIESQQPAREQAIFANASEINQDFGSLFDKFEQLMLTAYPNGRGQQLLDAARI